MRILAAYFLNGHAFRWNFFPKTPSSLSVALLCYGLLCFTLLHSASPCIALFCLAFALALALALALATGRFLTTHTIQLVGGCLNPGKLYALRCSVFLSFVCFNLSPNLSLSLNPFLSLSFRKYHKIQTANLIFYNFYRALSVLVGLLIVAIIMTIVIIIMHRLQRAECGLSIIYRVSSAPRTPCPSHGRIMILSDCINNCRLLTAASLQ